MPSDAELAVAAFFHARRAARKKVPLSEGEIRLEKAVRDRALREELERQAERSAWERGQGDD